ncbi:2-oxo-4-hydroxy-4-carboxy-5-ureidoimidazoline decarboxylase [Arthrobacter castelli]|uniref:2-oxo-4-hydroxy-4-carboxy-5-ureidoimidazoline decarboxylase n=1 Tax=Arthrobacter castelli TaxID=271431 RepID=UPI00040EEE3E|nr:2-oxo-4-hydroxy-4-carboxy-5-ureidoimidazoline decarboxylase [Arthrobacter castelli]
MTLKSFNEATDDEARQMLRPCADIPRWINEITAVRPFDSEAALLQYAEQAAPDWTATEIDGALAHHPRIGERAEGASAEASHSRREQAGVSSSDETAQQLIAGNHAYEEKFGRVFLIRAAGRSAEDILAALQQRLENTPEQELPIIAGQLREIAVRRLEGVLAE